MGRVGLTGVWVRRIETEEQEREGWKKIAKGVVSKWKNPRVGAVRGCFGERG